jgi:hypothetical protein
MCLTGWVFLKSLAVTPLESGTRPHKTLDPIRELTAGFGKQTQLSNEDYRPNETLSREKHKSAQE